MHIHMWIHSSETGGPGSKSATGPSLDRRWRPSVGKPHVHQPPATASDEAGSPYRYRRTLFAGGAAGPDERACPPVSRRRRTQGPPEGGPRPFSGTLGRGAFQSVV